MFLVSPPDTALTRLGVANPPGQSCWCIYNLSFVRLYETIRGDYSRRSRRSGTYSETYLGKVRGMRIILPYIDTPVHVQRAQSYR